MTSSIQSSKQAQKTGSLVGLLLLIEFLSVAYDGLFLSPESGAGIQTSSLQTVLSIIIAVLNGGICFTVITKLFPLTSRSGKAYLFFLMGLMFVKTFVSLIDSAALAQLVSTYDLPAVENSIRTGLFQSRFYTHNIDMLVSFLAFTIFFAVLLRLQLLPVAICVWGIAAGFIAITRQMMTFYGICTELNFVYFLPFASVRLFASMWLLVIGFGKNCPARNVHYT